MKNLLVIERLEDLVKSINSFLWGPPMMILLVGFGLISTIYLGFPQIKKFKLGFKESFGKFFSKDKTLEGSMSSFQALATAVAAQVGTGNLGGVAGAIVSGGPGAVFWMWVTALLGTSTIFVEAVLAQRYREKRNGEYVAGPAFYLSKGFKELGHEKAGRVLANTFAILIIIALGFIGNMVQSNSISSALEEAFGLKKIIVGFIIAMFAAFIFIGGMKRIASFAEMAVPFMALLYILGSIVVLIKYNHMIIPVFKEIFTCAFSSKAVLGGAVGVSVKKAIRYGVARGLFSNEAGMGSTPNSHGVADVKHPAIQGSVAMIGVFIDTIIICSATSLIILATNADKAGKEGVMITMEAFRIAFGSIGAKFLALALVFFAFTTIVGWYYFGLSNAKYLVKSKDKIKVYHVVVLIFIIVGSYQKVDLVWELTDMFNGLMVIPNVVGLFFLLKFAKKIYDDYDRQIEENEELHYTYYEDEN